MQLTVKGKHLNVGDALREHVHNHLSHTTGKYFRNPIEATVIFTKEKGHRYRADISVHIGGGIVLQAHNEAEDPYPAFDGASSRMATRLARYKDKLRDHHRYEDTAVLHEASYYTLQSNDDDATAVKAKDEPIVIAEMAAAVPTLAVADAVMRLELGDLPALMFKNPSSGAFNMVYRRKDKNIGWVEPLMPRKETPAPGSALVKKVKKPSLKKTPVKKAPSKARGLKPRGNVKKKSRRK